MQRFSFHEKEWVPSIPGMDESDYMLLQVIVTEKMVQAEIRDLDTTEHALNKP